MSDEELERAIDEAGRSAVFSRARALGWTTGEAPEWVWRQIADDVKHGRPSGNPPQRLDEALLGFRLF
jgi:hypothetical protein